MALFFRLQKSNIRRAPVRCEALESRRLLTIAVTATLPAVSVAAEEGAFPINLSNYFNEPNPAPDIAFFSTNLGVIPVQLTPNATPKTVANFESYVDSGAYNGTIVSELGPNSFFSGGTYTITNNQLEPITAGPAVVNEFGASNVRGTLSAGLQTTDPNSATDAFVFNDSDSNSAIFDSEKLTVFGNVIGSYGLGVMDSIASVPVPSPAPLSGFPSLPIINYTLGGTITVGQLVRISSVTIGSEGFAVSSDNSSIVTAVVTGDNLTYTPLAAGTAHLTVTGVGADGTPVSQTFSVIVSAANPATPITPSATGSLPASLVSGQLAKLHQAITLTASKNIDTSATIALSLTPTGGEGADFVVAAVQKHLKIKSGGHVVVKVSAKELPADVPGGSYEVVIGVTEPNSQSATAGDNQTVTVVQPLIDLGGSFKVLTAHAKAGHNATATLLVTNSGNAEASGQLKLNVTRSTDGSVLETPVKVIHLKAGKSIAIHLSWSAGTSGEQYSVDVQIDPNDAFNDENQSNNLVVSSTAVSVS